MASQMMGMVTVLSARKYQIVDDKTGELENRGIILKYVMDWDGQQRENDNGVDVMKASMPYEAWDSLPPLPADCMATFRMVPGRGDKGVVNIDSLDFKDGFYPVSALTSPNESKK